MTTQKPLISLLKRILGAEQTSLTLNELYDLRTSLDLAIKRKETIVRRDEDHHRTRFIEDVIAFGVEAQLPLTEDQLREVGRFLYDTEVSGITTEEIVAEALGK